MFFKIEFSYFNLIDLRQSLLLLLGYLTVPELTIGTDKVMRRFKIKLYLLKKHIFPPE